MPSTGAGPDAAREPPDSGPGDDSEAKRRKIRKGTRSCWECKRRKMRCSFSTPSDSVCLPCRRRGVRCVSQKYPEDMAVAASPTGDRGRHMGDRIVRVEALVEQLVKKVGNGSVGSASSGDPDPNTGVTAPGPCLSPVMPAPEPLTPLTTTTGSGGTQYESISDALHAALPPREDIHLMIKAGIDVSFHKLMTHPYPVLAQRPGGMEGNLAEIPSARTHPVLLAKYLLILATCLQFAHPELHAEEIRRLSEPPRQLMRRLADAAISLVTNKDEFLDSVEGLECIMLESIFEANSGHLRRAWFACRRAMLVAQLMGLHRSGIQQPLKVLDPSQPFYPSYFWFRIVCTDRQLCLMLGLPQGSLDVSMVAEAALANDTPEGRFERKQSVIASRILERNESSDPALMDDLAALQEIDDELQRAGNEMPSKWWLVPNLAGVVRDPDKTFWETIRLLDQMFYFNLLNLLHLPYMLRSQTPDTVKYDHSKLASANASRELLARFIMFRSFNRVAFSCRAVDFFALTAAMTLLMAHLDGHHKQWQQRQDGAGFAGINVLAHQRNSDRAMIEQVLENMECVAKVSNDVLSERSSSLLKSLLAFETDATQGKMYEDNFSAAAAMTELHPDLATDDGQFLRIGIPYFGTVRISREGLVSMEGPPRASTPPPMPQWPVLASAVASSRPSFGDVASEIPPIPPRSQQATQASSQAEQESQQPFAPQFPSAINDALQQQYLYPGLTAGVDDWAFQGVDMAFFDNLIRRPGVEDAGDGGSWANWNGAS